MEPTRSARPLRPETSIRVLWWLVGLMLTLEALASLADRGLMPFSRSEMFIYGAFWNPLLDGVQGMFDAQPATMFLSHALLHGGPVHVAMNTVVLLSVGKLVITLSSQGRALVLFALTAVGGGAMFWLLGPAGMVPMIGASGAVFGFLGAWKRWEFDALRASGRSVRPVALFVAGMVGLNVVMAIALQGGLAWEAHLGGGMVGWLVAPFLVRRAPMRRGDF